jgi:hypothetical protein
MGECHYHRTGMNTQQMSPAVVKPTAGTNVRGEHVCAVLIFMHSLLCTAVAVEVAVLPEIVFCILTEHLGKQKICAELIPHVLLIHCLFPALPKRETEAYSLIPLFQWMSHRCIRLTCNWSGKVPSGGPPVHHARNCTTLLACSESDVPHVIFFTHQRLVSDWSIQSMTHTYKLQSALMEWCNFCPGQCSIPFLLWYASMLLISQSCLHVNFLFAQVKEQLWGCFFEPENAIMPLLHHLSTDSYSTDGRSVLTIGVITLSVGQIQVLCDILFVQIHVCSSCCSFPGTFWNAPRRLWLAVCPGKYGVSEKCELVQ